jgi:hypothetical protein
VYGRSAGAAQTRTKRLLSSRRRDAPGWARALARCVATRLRRAALEWIAPVYGEGARGASATKRSLISRRRDAPSWVRALARCVATRLRRAALEWIERGLRATGTVPNRTRGSSPHFLDKYCLFVLRRTSEVWGDRDLSRREAPRRIARRQAHPRHAQPVRRVEQVQRVQPARPAWSPVRPATRVSLNSLFKFSNTSAISVRAFESIAMSDNAVLEER